MKARKIEKCRRKTDTKPFEEFEQKIGDDEKADQVSCHR
jgi:hypothetical protein